MLSLETHQTNLYCFYAVLLNFLAITPELVMSSSSESKEILDHFVVFNNVISDYQETRPSVTNDSAVFLSRCCLVANKTNLP